MTKPVIPVFNLTAGNINFDTDEALQAELAKTGGKWFDAPGNMDLVISAAEYHTSKGSGTIYCKGDPTWFNVKLTFTGADEKSIDHWLLVPTTRIEFGEKKTLMVFRKFQQFLNGIGESVHIAKLQAVLQKNFGDLSKLVGQKVNVDLGYEGDFVAKAADSDQYVVVVKGKPMQEDGADIRLPDRSSAVQYAKSVGVEPSFLRILKFTPRKSAKSAKAIAASDW